MFEESCKPSLSHVILHTMGAAAIKVTAFNELLKKGLWHIASSEISQKSNKENGTIQLHARTNSPIIFTLLLQRFTSFHINRCAEASVT